jgi:hypothetical protein
VAADTLANTQIGGTDNGPSTRVAYRFIPARATSLTAIRVYFETGSGYSGGTGGSRSVTIQTDSAGKPSGTILGSAAISGTTRFLTIPIRASLVAGTPYHVVFTNTDPSPSANFVSANALYAWDLTSQPRYPGWQVLMDTGAGWVVRSRMLPILQLDDAMGSQGVGYMECWQTRQPAISGARRVREHFTVSGGDRRVSEVSVRLKRDSTTTGTSPLTVRLESGGDLVATGTIPATSFPLGTQVDGPGNHNAWGTATFAAPITLVSGRTYDLVLSAPGDTVFRAMAIREGVSYSFDSDTYFADGIGQQDDGSGWRGFDQPGGTTSSTQGDVQFYFR